MSEVSDRLRALLSSPGLLVMPCCFDAHSARLIEAAGFDLTLLFVKLGLHSSDPLVPDAAKSTSDDATVMILRSLARPR